MKVHLGMNTIYATKRWPEPDAWGQQIGQRWGLKHVQFVFDLLDPRSIPSARQKYCAEVKQAGAKYGFEIHNCFIGVAAYTYNYLLHPFKELRDDALDWCDKAALCSRRWVPKGWADRLPPPACASTRIRRGGSSCSTHSWKGCNRSPALPPNTAKRSSSGNRRPSAGRWGHPLTRCRSFTTGSTRVQPFRFTCNSTWATGAVLSRNAKTAISTPGFPNWEGSPRFCIFSKWTACGTATGAFPGKTIRKGVIKMEKVLETLDKIGCKEVYWYPELCFAYELNEETLLQEMDESVEYLKRFV